MVEQSASSPVEMSKRQAWTIISGVAVVLVVIIAASMFLLGLSTGKRNPETTLAELPAPELSEGERGELGIDKNVNESTIDNYLGRSDAVYRDLRLFDDPGNYESIGGDHYLSGYIDGFEVVSFPYIAPVADLPASVGEVKLVYTLYNLQQDGSYQANYQESLSILEDLFPRDKIIFLMCGGGGYAGAMKKLLISLGWDASKIYNVGGYWNYTGAHKIEIKQTSASGETTYAFWKIPYHEIDFTRLTPSNTCSSETSETDRSAFATCKK